MTRFGCFVDLPRHGEHAAEPTPKCIAVASFCFVPRTRKNPLARAAVADEQRCQPPVVTIGGRAAL